jgi:hypothetical protein
MTFAIALFAVLKNPESGAEESLWAEENKRRESFETKFKRCPPLWFEAFRKLI